MTKQEHIQWWIDEADRNWETAIFNMNGKQNVFALFAFYLTIKKLFLAIWVRDNEENFPPMTHNLTKLYDESVLELDKGWFDYLIIVNDWSIKSRYPDYKLKLYKRVDYEYVNEHKGKLEVLRDEIKQKLVS